MSSLHRVAVICGDPGDIRDAVAERLTAEDFTIAGIRELGEVIEITAFFDSAERRFGGVDVVVILAGDGRQRVDVRGAFVASHLAAARVRPSGAIVHVASAVTGDAVHEMSRTLAGELRDLGIVVNSIESGPSETPEDIAGLVSYLVGPARWVQGRTLTPRRAWGGSEVYPVFPRRRTRRSLAHAGS